MSYILDALKKADAQRVSDPARGIHAQTAAPTLDMRADVRRPLLGLRIAGAAFLIAAVAWFWMNGVDGPSPEATTPALFVIESGRVPPVAAAVLPAPPPEIVATPQVRRPAPRDLEKDERESREGRAAREKQSLATATLRAPAAIASAAPVPLPGPAEAPVPAVTVPERVYSLAEAPADVRQALAKLSISGGVYSENVAQRMLIVNGQVFNEGSEIAPGVVVEQIRAKVVLLKYRGLRITQPY